MNPPEMTKTAIGGLDQCHMLASSDDLKNNIVTPLAAVSFLNDDSKILEQMASRYRAIGNEQSADRCIRKAFELEEAANEMV